MRRFFLAATILSIVAGGPLQAQAGDREIAEQIIQKLKVQRDAGTLKDFTLDLKVDKGVVLMRGSVREPAQKEGVLAAAKGIEGIANVVDEISIGPKVATATPTAATTPTADATATVVRPKATIATAEPVKAPVASTKTTKSSDAFSFKQALAATKTVSPEVKPNTAKNTEVKTDAIAALAPTSSPSASAVTQANRPAPWAPIGGVEMAAATESSVESDRAITSAVVASLGNAQRQGRLKGFGVDVNTQDGRVYVNGRASSEAHRELINDLVRKTPGVVEVIDEIAVYDSTSSMPLPLADNSSNEPLPLTDYAPNLTPVNVEPVDRATRGGTPAMAVSNRMGVPAQTAPYPMQQGVPMQAMPAGMPMHGGVMGAPVPMAPYAGGAAAPRYEQPYLPNYAWPGYAAYPNYAAVTYPQQYSPSAWPYIGPFYPYPQVPLGWRKVSLEWDDGWWFLDFTDK
jgi:osmotically-inducible protein OsmY